MRSKSDDLRQLLGSLRQQASSKRFFIVFDDLRRNLSKDLVSGVLAELEHPKHQHSNLVSTILDYGLKVFSILAWINQEEHILSFVKHDELDARLPMDENQVCQIDSQVQDRFWKEVQWEYLPYHFRRDDFHHVIRDLVIMPFITEDQHDEGAAGEIFKSTIHASQQSFFRQKVCVPPA
jgi:hypothetical protein